MGIDIHVYVETLGEDGEWHAVSAIKNDKEELENWLYDDRDYFLFSALAGVSDFTQVTLIVEPRGLPEDLSSAVSEHIDPSLHDLSYLTLAELENYNWNQVVPCSGYVDYANYQEFLSKGVPSTWFNAVSDADLVSNDSLEPNTKKYTSVSWGTKVDFSKEIKVLQNMAAMVQNPNVQENVALELEALGIHALNLDSVDKINAKNNIRIVFGFDS